ncbi:MAG TPA: VCBS repeat-containing protein [Candidatus Sumerlaeota bacterium]|nr:VCBS repeat-containing protein [Candidatus Sumerlaeota bacterium]
MRRRHGCSSLLFLFAAIWLALPADGPCQEADPDSVAPPRVQSIADPHGYAWVTQNRYRVLVQCPPFPVADASYRPTFFDLDFDSYVEAGLIETKDWSPDSIRVVRYDRETRQVIPASSGGGDYLPCKVERWQRIKRETPGSPQELQPYRVSWLREPDDGDSVYAIYFDLIGHGETEYRAPPSYIGTGDALAFGTSEPQISTVRGVPIPVDWNGDGRKDLLCAKWTSPGKGVSLRLNLGEMNGEEIFSLPRPIYQPLPGGLLQIDDVNEDGKLDLVCDRGYFTDFVGNRFGQWNHIPDPRAFNVKDVLPQSRSQNYYVVDWDGDSVKDVLISCCVWFEYGWANAFDEKGEWKNGPLDGRFYFFKNLGSNDDFVLDYPLRMTSNDGKPLSVYGYAKFVVQDFDNDGDLDIISSDFLNHTYFFENVGSRSRPEMLPAQPILTTQGPFESETQALNVVACDWDDDGDVDLLTRAEDERCALLENLLTDKGELVFKPSRYLQCYDENPVMSQLVAIDLADWDGDGDQDLIAGNSAGYVGIYRNTGADNHLSFANLEMFKGGTKPIRFQAGYNGSVQGPAEALWGYAVPEVADWNQDGFPDLLCNSIWGLIVWFENPGEIGTLNLTAERPVRVEWPQDPPKPVWRWWDPEPGQWSTQWRSKVQVLDYDDDGLLDAVALDYDGYLVLHRRSKDQNGQLRLGPGERVFLNEDGDPWQINPMKPGSSGRNKFELVDWDGDGDLDLLQSGKDLSITSWHMYPNIRYFENIKLDGTNRFIDRGDLMDVLLANHTASPAVLDIDQDGVLDLLVGSEDGHIYCYHRSYIEYRDALAAEVVQDAG